MKNYIYLYLLRHNFRQTTLPDKLIFTKSVSFRLVAILGLWICLLYESGFAQDRRASFDWNNGLRWFSLAHEYDEKDLNGIRNPDTDMPGAFNIISDDFIRTPGTKSVWQQVDCLMPVKGQTHSTNQRAEIHKNLKSSELKVVEGSTVWFGWSEMYPNPQELTKRVGKTFTSSFDYDNTTTIIQWRSQDSGVPGSPAMELQTSGADVYLRTHYKNGSGGLSARQYGPVMKGIEIGVWYDYVVMIKYTKKNEPGSFKIWARRPDRNEPFDYNNPNFVYDGPTMIVTDNRPHLRFGIYRHKATKVEYKKFNHGNLDATNRTVSKFLGPFTILVGSDNKSNFDAVKQDGPLVENAPQPVPPKEDPIPDPDPDPDPRCDLPTPWKSQDIGNVALKGSGCEANGNFTIKAAGSDIWHSADEFHYTYQPVSGDAVITARINSVQQANYWTKAGLMLREGLNPSSAYVLMGVTPVRHLLLQYRSASNANSEGEETSPGAFEFPYYVRLERKGDKLIGYYSANGSNWTQHAQVELPMQKDLYIGIAVTSHDVNTLTQAVFDQVQVVDLDEEVPTPAYPIPTFDISGNITIEEDFTSTQTIQVTPQSTDKDMTVSYSLSPTNINFANVKFDPQTGEVNFTSRRDASGKQTFTITADNGQTQNNRYKKSFTFEVVPVNDPPIFEVKKYITLNENFSGLHTIRVNPVSVPQDEANQEVTYTLSPLSVDFINLQFNKETGEIILSPKPNAIGSQVFTLVADDGAGDHNTFSGVLRITVIADKTQLCELPNVWLAQDIGTPQHEGMACFKNGTFSLKASGNDIGETNDEYLFTYQPFSGNGEMISRVHTVSPETSNAKIGLMIREQLSPSSAHMMISTSPVFDITSIARTTAQKSTDVSGTITTQSQYIWLKLRREADSFFTYYSLDGNTWEFAEEKYIEMPEQVFWGLALTSTNNTQIATAEVDEVSIKSIENPTPQIPDPQSPSAVCFEESKGFLSVEAEHYINSSQGTGLGEQSSWELVSDADASNGQMVHAVGSGFNAGDNLYGARLDYQVKFHTAGTYYLWGRVNTPGTADNSFHAGLNGEAASFGGLGITNHKHNQFDWTNTVASRKVELAVPKAGEYTLSIWVREDGAQVDKLVIVKDPKYVPSGMGPFESNTCGNDTTLTNPDVNCDLSTNLALEKPTFQSSQYGFGISRIAVDNDLDGTRGPWGNASITHTQKDYQAWWEVDLGAAYPVDSIYVKGRTDCCQKRLRRFFVMASPKPFVKEDLYDNLAQDDVWYTYVEEPVEQDVSLSLEKVAARYIRIQLEEVNYLSLSEVQVWGCEVEQEVAVGYNNSLRNTNQSISPIEDPNLILSPNPTLSHTKVSLINDWEGNFNIMIYDATGKICQTKMLYKSTEEFHHMIKLNELVPGVYIVTVRQNDEYLSKRLLVTPK